MHAQWLLFTPEGQRPAGLGVLQSAHMARIGCFTL
jgi:hypothetical protein